MENVAICPKHWRPPLRPSFSECDTGEFASTHMTNEGRKDRQIHDLFLGKIRKSKPGAEFPQSRAHAENDFNLPNAMSYAGSREQAFRAPEAKLARREPGGLQIVAVHPPLALRSAASARILACALGLRGPQAFQVLQATGTI
jgi:hypothetical protein